MTKKDMLMNWYAWTSNTSNPDPVSVADVVVGRIYWFCEGSHEIEAECVKVNKTTAVFETDGGRKVSIPKYCWVKRSNCLIWGGRMIR